MGSTASLPNSEPKIRSENIILQIQNISAIQKHTSQT